MNDLSKFIGALSRREGQSLAELEGQARYKLAQVEVTADIQAAKAGAVAYVGRRAMLDVALLSQLEVQLAMAVPAAVTRLQAIADVTALGLSEVVMDSVHKLRKC